MENEGHDKILEKEFEQLSYGEIQKILAELGTIFAVPIEEISKQEIYTTIEWDYPIEKIKEVMEKLKKGK